MKARKDCGERAKRQMIRVYCHTNLDLKPAEKWPRTLCCRPMVGDYINSEYDWNKWSEKTSPLFLQLRVCGVTVYHDHCDVELHLPLHFKSIIEFQEWYRSITNSI